MSVTVSPDTFRFVRYDAVEIAQVAERLVAAIGLDVDVHLEIDETTPLSRIHVESGDVLTLHAQSGAFEDTRRPQQFSIDATERSLGHVLMRAHDRRSGLFESAPPDEELSLEQRSAWTSYCMGRLSRLGVAVNEQRYRYDFRNRHGFNDAVDAAFDRLWTATGLGWEQVDAISSGVRAGTGASAGSR